MSNSKGTMTIAYYDAPMSVAYTALELFQSITHRKDVNIEVSKSGKYRIYREGAIQFDNDYWHIRGIFEGLDLMHEYISEQLVSIVACRNQGLDKLSKV